jgi:iron complex transport system substrate-binding protein
MWHLRITWAAAGLIAALAAGAAWAQGRASLAVQDDRGVTVQAPVTPKRVAGISYLATDLALALGIKPYATTYMTGGRTPDFLLGLTKDMVQLGQRAKPNLEILSNAKPDLIIAMKRYTAANAQHLEKIAPYLAFNMELLSESEKEVAELAKVFGKPERGQQLNAAFKQHLQDYTNRAPKSVHPRFLIMWAGDTPFSLHDESTAASIAIRLGGINVAGPMSRAGRFGSALSLETLLEKNPEVIFVYDSGPDRPHENNPIWKELSAVKNKRVHYVGDHWVEANGPIAREIVLREAAHCLYPDTFPAINVRAEASKLIPAALQQ